MNIQWQQQVVLITGASGGIGSAIAKALDKKGARLILAGRNEIKLNQLANSLSGEAIVVTSDITTPQGRETLYRACEGASVSILINNAGSTHVGQFNTAPIEALVNLNLTAPMLLTQRLIPLLARRSHAHVVNVGSAFGSIGFAAHSTYCATKFALRGWTESLQREYHNSTIDFHYLAPRATDTTLNDDRVVALNNALGNHVDHVDVVAKHLINQLEKGKPRVAIGFAERLFAKINGLFPSIVDRALAKKLPIIEKHAYSAPSTEGASSTCNSQPLSAASALSNTSR
ncbi:SDR family oxidoreductase [Alteromonas sp. D210916BOD_24]|uniref:SDR family oxidoreductase n=1 Tax=Alteromonas sp. D210916BOD_24 TaxID=3157618 RepID=UPI00399C4E44